MIVAAILKRIQESQLPPFQETIDLKKSLPQSIIRILANVRIKESRLGASNLRLTLLLRLNLRGGSLDLTSARETSVYLTYNY